MTDSHADFASAALRHIRDAEHLAAEGEHTSRDQAWHLAGFAHECARKALLRGGWVPKMLGHDFDSAGELVVELATALDPRASRLPVTRWADHYAAIEHWRPDHRYERTGQTARRTERKLEDLIAQGRAAVDGCLVALFLEGSLTVESLQ